MGLNIGDWLTYEFQSSHAKIRRYPILYRMSKRRSCSELDMADSLHFFCTDDMMKIGVVGLLHSEINQNI